MKAATKKSSVETRKRASAKRTRGTTRTRRAKGRYWSGEVTRNSNALDLEAKVFRSGNPHNIALSLKRSAQHSRRRKGTAYQSAMSMLTFYINRAGRNLPQRQKGVLQRAKQELRKAFGRA
jgi:putative cell wall-binding protein